MPAFDGFGEDDMQALRQMGAEALPCARKIGPNRLILMKVYKGERIHVVLDRDDLKAINRAAMGRTQET